MGTYGRNFEFRYPPDTDDRRSRFAAPAGSVIPIGAPVMADTSAGFDALGLQIVKLAPAGTDPVLGLSGIAVFEYAPAAFAGDDPFLTTYSDKDTLPTGKAVQVVSAPGVKVVFTNTTHRSFLGQRDYAGRIMVAGLGATPTLIVGDYLEPGTGTDVAGYWREVAGVSGAWLVVTSVDTARQEVEAEMLF